MLKGQFHFAHDAIALCSRAPRRAELVEFEVGESSGAVIHDGVIRASVEHECRGLAVYLAVLVRQNLGRDPKRGGSWWRRQTIIGSIQQEDPGGGQPAGAWSAHIQRTGLKSIRTMPVVRQNLGPRPKTGRFLVE